MWGLCMAWPSLALPLQQSLRNAPSVSAAAPIPVNLALPFPPPPPASSGALDAGALGTAGFADSLAAFCGEADEESSVIGGPTLLKFVSTFREVGGA